MDATKYLEKKSFGEWATSDGIGFDELTDMGAKLGIAYMNKTLEMSKLSEGERKAVSKSLDNKELTEDEYKAAKAAIKKLYRGPWSRD